MSIARYRPKAPLLEITAVMPPKVKPTIQRYRPPKPKPPGEFALLAREILSRPPLRHRGELPKAGLSVFEFCIGVAATILARRDREARAHRAGLRGGKRAMTAKRNSEQPVVDKAQYSPRLQFKDEGSAGFERGRQRYRDDHAKEDWYFETSRAQLLRYAGLSLKADNNRNVDAALDRLARAVRNHPSVLVGWRELGGQRIELEVRYEWLSLHRYSKVSMPLPTSSRHALALYLFLSVINPSPRNKTSIPAKALYSRLGIQTGRPAHDKRALRHALDRVNEHRTTKQGLSAIDLSHDGKGGWRFTEHGKRKKAISVDDIKEAMALRQNPDLSMSWSQVADLLGHTPLEIQQAVKSYQKSQQAESEDGDRHRGRPREARAASPDEVHDVGDGREGMTLNYDDYDDWRRGLSDRYYEKQKARQRAHVSAWLKRESGVDNPRDETMRSDERADDSDAGIKAWCKEMRYSE
jgi:hypothetical protein